MAARPPLSVAVLVDLVRTPRSGGHVKCWERFAQAAAGTPEVDLTVYVLGRRPGTETVADNVRFVALRPVVSSGTVHRLVGGVDAGDLAPFHPGLSRRLPRHQVWHLTHTLAFTATALWLRDRHGRRLVGSVHTDVPFLTGTYTEQVVARLPAALAPVTRSLRVAERTTALARRRRDRMLRACSHLLASNPADADEFAAVAPGIPVTMLRRGIDPALFSPRAGDRERLTRRYGVPPHPFRVLFAGRVDGSKGAPLVAEAVRRLTSSGRPVHLVLAGDGAAVPSVVRSLGPAVTHVGHVPQSELARVYAGCDVLAFPSRSETAGNVVPEAMATGLPAVLPRGGRTAQWLATPGEDGLLVHRDDPAAWAQALASLQADPARLRAMAGHARETVLRTVPSWSDVLREDLVPVWEAAAAPITAPSPGPTPPAPSAPSGGSAGSAARCPAG